MASYRYADTLSNGLDVKSIYCFNPNGSQASFSPLHVLTSKDGTIKDTLNGGIMGFSVFLGMTTRPIGR